VVKVYITKYALTKGIQEAEASQVEPTMIRVGVATYYHKPDWHENRKDAVVRAVKMRNEKIDSLRCQIIKLRILIF
jgi:hypothetical protein